MSMINRIKSAYRVLTGNVPTNAKDSPYQFSNVSPKWAMGNWPSYYSEGFSGNSLIYSAIMTKAQSVAQANLVAAKGSFDKPEIIPSENKHPLNNLLTRPNPYMSGDFFNTLQTVYLNITGNAFTFLFRKGNKVVEMWPLRPDKISIIPTEDGQILGYGYKAKDGTEVRFLRSDVMHVKFPNPADDLSGLGFGLSPLASIARVADVDNMVTSFLNIMFQQGAMPAGFISFNELGLEDWQIAEVQQKWAATYGSYSNWSKPVVLGAGAEYHKLGQSFDEIGFDKLDYRSEARILSALRVPAELVPSQLGMQGSTFSNKQESRRWFWEDVISFELGLFIDEYRYYLTDGDAFPYWDLSRVPALNKDVDVLVNSAKSLFEMGVPPSIAFQIVGLNIPEYEGSDFSYVSSNTVLTESLSAQPSPEQMPVNEVQEQLNLEIPKQEKSMFPQDVRETIYKAVDNIAVSHENAFGNAAEKAFENDRMAILAIIKSVKSESILDRKSVNWAYVSDLITGYLSGEARDNWRESFVPVFSGLLNDTGNFWAGQLGFEFDIRNIEGELWLQEYKLIFANPITDTSNSEIRNIISIAQKEGWSIDKLSSSIDLVFDQWIYGDVDPIDLDFVEPGKPFWRRELIARTETTRLQNAGATNLFKRWGVEKKEWLATGDGRTRSSHRGMDSQIVSIDGLFQTPSGITLRYPGDPNAPISETANCRCAVAPYIEYEY